MKKKQTKYQSGGGIGANNYPDFSGLQDLTNQLGDFFANSPVYDVDPTTRVPTFNQENFDNTIEQSVQTHFEQNPIPELPNIGDVLGLNPFKDLMDLQQKPFTGDPFHKNLVQSLTVGPNQGFQYGGSPMAGGDLAIQGYSDGSPYANRSFIDIPGGRIDMSKTGKPLALAADNGQRKIAMPYSGNHFFSGANKVRETPLFQMGGEVSEEVQLQPIQTEKGEYISFEDASITPVLAKKSHKAQDKSEVTDMLPNGAYVYSQDKKMALSKAKAEDFSFGYTAVDYEENEAAMAPPTELLLADIFKNKKELPANLVKNIKRKYPATERESDAFAIKAKEENLASRQPYLQGIQIMSEMQKPREEEVPVFQLGGGIFRDFPNSFANNPTYEDAATNRMNKLNTFQGDNALKGPAAPMGMANNPYFQQGFTPNKAQLGGEVIGAALEFLPNVIGLFQQGKQNKAIRAAMDAQIAQANRVQEFAEGQYQNVLDTRDRLLPEAKNLYATQQGNLQNASMASLAGIMGQDPNFDAPDLGATRSILAAQADRVPNAVRNQAYSAAATPFRSVARNLGRISPNQRSAVLANAGANELNSRSQLSANFAGQDINLGNKYLQQLANLEQQDASNLANQQNQIRANQNNQIGSAANVGTNFFNQSNQLAQGNLANQLAIEASVAPGLAGALNSMTNATNGLTGAYGLMQPLAQGQANFMNGLVGAGNSIYNLGNQAGWWGNQNNRLNGAV